MQQFLSSHYQVANIFGRHLNQDTAIMRTPWLPR